MGRGLVLLLLAVGSSALVLTAVERRFGRGKRSALEVLGGGSTVAKDVRRAETAWRQVWTKARTTPRAEEAEVALHALGSIRDGKRVQALVRALERTQLPPEARLWSAAVSALACSGEAEAAAALLAKRDGSADVLALALAADDETARERGAQALRDQKVVVRALLRMQRAGELDLHGLTVPQAELAIVALLDDDAESRTPNPRRKPMLGEDGLDGGLVVVVGRGLRSPGGFSPVRQRVLDLVAQHPDACIEHLENNPGILLLKREREA